jgi:uncharacterized RDD family membrane protein YckC
MTYQVNPPIAAGRRLGAMLLDHLVMSIITMLFFIPASIVGFSDAMKVTHEQETPGFFSGPLSYLSMLGFCLYFCKDIVNGRSIAKRLLHLQVVDNKTGQVASPMQSFVRNLFCIIWPIEVPISLFNTSRRLGDRVAGTRVVEFDPLLEQPQVEFPKLLWPVSVSFALLILVVNLLPQPATAKPAYNNTTYNKVESVALKDLLKDSLGHFMIPDVRVYDSVKNEKLKYISVIMRLKENYLGNDELYEDLHTQTIDLIYSRIPKETFTGQVKFFYKSEGYFKSRTSLVGTPVRGED